MENLDVEDDENSEESNAAGSDDNSEVSNSLVSDGKKADDSRDSSR